MHGAERVLPVLPYCFERTARGGRSSRAADQVPGILRVPPNPEPEDDLTLLPIRQLEWNVDRPAGIETGPHFARQAHPCHRDRIAKRAITPNKLSPVATDGPSRLVYVEEGNPPSKLCVIGISSEDCPASGIHFGHHVHHRFWPKIPQHPFHVARCGQLARSA